MRRFCSRSGRNLVLRACSQSSVELLTKAPQGSRGVSPAVHLSQRGKIEFAALMEEIAVSPDAHFMSGLGDSRARTWTFAGTKENRTYARMAGGGGRPVKFDAVSIQAPAAALSTACPKCKTLQLTTKEQTAFSAEIKFAPCVPS